MFNKRIPEAVDPKANNKYCNPKILEDVLAEFKIVDTDCSGDISYDEYKASHLAKTLCDEEARRLFDRIDLNKNGVLEIHEFQAYRLSSGLHQVCKTDMYQQDFEG